MAKNDLKQVGKRRGWNPVASEADRWLRTVHELRKGEGVCRKGLFKFRTFEEADQWMEEMIPASIRGSRQ